MKIPLPELEICILALRALLKYRDRDAFKDILKIRSAGLPRDILNEIRWLFDQTSMDRIDQILAQAGNDLPVGVIREFLGTVLDNSRAGWKFIQLRREVRRAMRTYQNNSRWLAIRRYFQETWRRRTTLRLEPPRKMTLVAGGMTIAMVGADGSGKSTLTKELKSWLGWKIDVVVKGSLVQHGSNIHTITKRSVPYVATHLVPHRSRVSFVNGAGSAFGRLWGSTRQVVSEPTSP